MRRAALLLALAVPASAQSQDVVPDAPIAEASTPDGEDIVVTGMGATGYRLTADQLRDAVRAFEQHKAEFAPDATLRWRVLPVTEAEGLAVRLVRGNERIEVAVDAAGEFTLPAEPVLSGNWRLQTNAGRRQIRIRPLTFSPGSTDSDYRMGDGRLLCRVFWAFANNQFSLFQRMAFGAVGGCGSRRVAIWYRSEEPVATARAGDLALDVREDGSAYRPLLHDAGIGNDVRVLITHR